MRRVLLALGLLLLGLTPANAQHVTGIEIIAPGIYTAHIVNKERYANGLGANGMESEQLALKTTTVPMQQGVDFGFRYRLSGTPAEAAVKVRKVILFPSPGLKPPGHPTVTEIEETLDRTIGETTYTGYLLEEPFELVPGKWTFQLWWGDAKLAEQSFTLVAQ